MKRFMLSSIFVALCACGGGEGVDISQRPATSAECPTGGSTLVVDGDAVPVCNGENGVDGDDGAPGTSGEDGVDGQNGADGRTGTNGTNGSSAAPPGLVEETVFCSATSVDPAPFRSVTYKHARLYDGSLFVSVTCDTVPDQDTATDLFSSAQIGAASGIMGCLLVDELGAVISIIFTPNFLTRRLQVTEDSTVVLDQAFDTDCTVVAGS